jgi:hypothetical protein
MQLSLIYLDIIEACGGHPNQACPAGVNFLISSISYNTVVGLIDIIIINSCRGNSYYNNAVGQAFPGPVTRHRIRSHNLDWQKLDIHSQIFIHKSWWIHETTAMIKEQNGRV